MERPRMVMSFKAAYSATASRSATFEVVEAELDCACENEVSDEQIEALQRAIDERAGQNLKFTPAGQAGW